MAIPSAPVEAAGPARQALYLNEAAHSLVYHAPAASQRLGASFAKLVPSVVRWGEEAPYGRPARVLWGHETSRPQPHAATANTRSCLPDAYAWANPTCNFCSVPLVPGVNAQHDAPRSRRRTSEVSLTTCCQTCRKHWRLRKPRTAARFSSVRRRPPLQQVMAAATRASAPPPAAASAATAASAPATALAPSTPRVSSSTRSAESSAPRPARQPQVSRASAGPFDTKAGLRTLLQQKKQKDQKARQQAPPAGGLADFLRQL